MSDRGEREIVIRLKIPAAPRTRWLLAIGAGVLTCAAVAYAADFSPFAAHEKLSADKMNQNFTALQTRIATLEGGRVVAIINALPYSVGATTYCGQTAGTTGDLANLAGAGVGLAKAKAACQASCSSTSAHMCTTEELVRTTAVSKPILSDGWFYSGVFGLSTLTDANANINDCHNFTSAQDKALGGNNTDLALVWTPASNTHGQNKCSATFPVLCCD